MKIDKENLNQMIYSVIDNNKELIYNEQNIDKNTVLYGDNSLFDSLGFINFIVAIEDEISSKYNFKITLADERAMAEKNNPFGTVELLTEYILKIVAEEK